jgi:hypothetical protein
LWCATPRHARVTRADVDLAVGTAGRTEQAGKQETTQHLRLRADWMESGQREGRAGDHTKQVHVHQSRSRTDEADEPGKWHAEPPLSVSPSLPGREANGNPKEHRPNTDSMVLQRSWPFFSPLFYTEPTSEADLPKCSRRKVLKSRLTVNIPFITTGKKCRYLKAGLEICVLASERFVF